MGRGSSLKQSFISVLPSAEHSMLPLGGVPQGLGTHLHMSTRTASLQNPLVQSLVIVIDCTVRKHIR